MRKNWWIALLLVIALIPSGADASGTASASALVPGGLYRITFLDVGQGDAALLQDPSGFTVLIDGGMRSDGPVIVDYLRSQGITQIDVLLATHPDADHIGGLIAVLGMDDVPVLSVITNGYPGDTRTWSDFNAAVTAEGLTLTTVTYDQSFSWGSMAVQAANPEPGLVDPDANDACLAVRVSMGAIDTFFACDLDADQESIILSRPVELDSEILKVAHHGSDLGSSAEFLAAVTPEVAVISVGYNSYGHPGAQTLARLDDAGAGVWRTDQDGHITVLTDGARFTVNAPFFAHLLYLPTLVK